MVLFTIASSVNTTIISIYIKQESEDVLLDYTTLYIFCDFYCLLLCLAPYYQTRFIFLAVSHSSQHRREDTARVGWIFRPHRQGDASHINILSFIRSAVSLDKLEAHLSVCPLASFSTPAYHTLDHVTGQFYPRRCNERVLCLRANSYVTCVMRCACGICMCAINMCRNTPGRG